MTNKATPIPKWWSEDVRAWFAEGFSPEGFLIDGISYGTLSAQESEQLYRLANDPRMKYVATTLKKNLTPRPPDSPHYPHFPLAQDVQFLNSVLFASVEWALIQRYPRGRVRKNASDFSNECGKFMRFLERERERIEGMLFVRATEKYKSRTDRQMERGAALVRAKYGELIATMGQLRAAADAGLDDESLMASDSPHIPVKLNQDGANEVFVIRYLADQAEELFHKPLHRVVAVSATVSLDLPHEIDPERVKDLLKQYRKKKRGCITSELPF